MIDKQKWKFSEIHFKSMLNVVSRLQCCARELSQSQSVEIKLVKNSTERSVTGSPPPVFAFSVLPVDIPSESKKEKRRKIIKNLMTQLEGGVRRSERA
jgi:hypothetical protein